MKINKSIYKLLQPYEAHLSTAYYADYFRFLSNQKINDILAIARKAGYTGSVIASCNNCCLKFLKEVAKDYFAYKKSINDK